MHRQEQAIPLAQFPHDLSVDGFSLFAPKRFGQIGTGHIRPEDRPNYAERNPNQQDENDQPSLHECLLPPESLFTPPLGTSSEPTPAAAR